jgi:hypothetical protein
MQDIAPVAHTPVPSIEALIEEALHEPIEFFHPEDAPSGDFTDDEDFEDQPTDIGRLEDFGVDPYRPKR